MNLFDEEHPIFADIAAHILKAFWAYHQENPHVFDLFLKFARDVRQAGWTKYSATMIMNRIRWHYNIEKKATFKVNDHHTPSFARLAILRFPDEFTDFFELRSPQKRKQIYREMNYHGEMDTDEI